MKKYDAVVVGSGPNGLAAAITMARAGHSVKIFEAQASFGGGMRSEALTQPGFLHDVCSAVHPLAVLSPFFRALDLRPFGLEWIEPPIAAAHPLPDGDAVILANSLEETARNLGEDADAYLRKMKPFVDHWPQLVGEILQPVFHWPQQPCLLSRFGLSSLLSAETFARKNFRGPRARALFAGIAAHANAPLTAPGTAAIGLMLNLAAHARGWPVPRGGSLKIAAALLAYFQSLGGESEASYEIRSHRDLPPSRWVFLDLTPRQILRLFDRELPEQKRWRNYRYGPGVFKMDWALRAPIPWRSPRCKQAATVHLGGLLENISLSEAAPAENQISAKPYVLLTQPSLFDNSRAPQGLHTAWAYCHVPHASRQNLCDLIEAQVEAYAPGFRELILGRSFFNTEDLEKKNANLIGGDISGGAVHLRQLLFRPSLRWNPYKMSIPGYYICSSSTPPGPGVHGMGGYNAALSALQKS